MRLSPSLVLLGGFAAVAPGSPPCRPGDFASDWPQEAERVWIGPEWWANRLQDWRLRGGRAECVETRPEKPLRTLHLLTHTLVPGGGGFRLSVRTGPLAPQAGPFSPQAASGFLAGAGGGVMDPRAAALIHHSRGPRAGILAGIDGAGRVFFEDLCERAGARPEIREQQATGAFPRRAGAKASAGVLLVLEAHPPAGGRTVRLDLSARDPDSAAVVDRAELELPAARLAGGLALVSHPGRGKNSASFWFRDFTAAGAAIAGDEQRRLGPILSTQYTLSGGILKMTAQLLPVGPGDRRTASLQVLADGEWVEAGAAPLVVPGWTATFRVPNWDASRDTPYRVAYGESEWSGTVRRDPVEKEALVVAGFTGNHNNRRGLEGGFFDWRTGVWFPHADLTSRVAAHGPDLLFFSGDQVYEGSSPTRPDHEKLELDYLYKWYLWCWAYRELTRSVPAVTIPDDHDDYQGNLWGEGGRRTDKDDKGGYVWPAAFVRMVERTQTSHLPDPHDPAPVAQGIGVYTTSMTWGRVSFAILEDRKFKSGPSGRVEHRGSRRADHITDPDFDVLAADLPGLVLLGERQRRFLAEWAADWRGADMKVALSQTVFANLATHHGPALERLIADLDSNGWPQSGRNRALRELRRGFAFHLCGDQHLATLAHHGIDTWEDAIWSFAVPSVANFYPRAWRPEAPGANREPGAPEYTGRHLDGLKNRVTVCAATNPGRSMGREPADLHDGMPGYGILRLDRRRRTITAECWPRSTDPADPGARQYEGWPRTIHQLENHGRPAAYLPRIEVEGMIDPVVQVVEERTGEVVYTLRIRGTSFRPGVFAPGSYTVRAGEPGTPSWKTLRGVEAAGEESTARLEVRF